MLRALCFLTILLGVKSASGLAYCPKSHLMLSDDVAQDDGHAKPTGRLALKCNCRNAPIAPFIKPCKAGDNACAVASAQAAVPYIAPGVPELGIKPLDPMHIDLIKGDQAGLELSFKDTTVKGMKGCTVEAIKNDFTKMKQFVTIKCSVDLTGNYLLGGQLLIFPIKGDGKYSIQIRDIIIKTASELKTVTGADGKPHWHIDSWKHNYQVKTGAHFVFENLFNGNKVLAQPVEDFVNTNWKDVMQEVAPPVVKAIVAEVVNAVNALYAAVPAEQLFFN